MQNTKSHILYAPILCMRNYTVAILIYITLSLEGILLLIHTNVAHINKKAYVYVITKKCTYTCKQTFAREQECACTCAQVNKTNWQVVAVTDNIHILT